MNELQRTKERMYRIEVMIITIFERLQALEMDNVKNKAQIERTKNSFKVHIQTEDAHKI